MEKKSLRRPKHSITEVTEPEEEEEEEEELLHVFAYTWAVVESQFTFHIQSLTFFS
jgi:hypothetical protein